MERARELFIDEGMHCAQAVFQAMLEQMDVEVSLPLSNLPSGFAGGILRRGEQCGALSGAILALGYKKGLTQQDGNEFDLFGKGSQIVTLFKDNFGSTKCFELIEHDLRTEEGRNAHRIPGGTREKKCANFVEFVANLCREALET